jgi:hypothetical protein
MAAAKECESVVSSVPVTSSGGLYEALKAMGSREGPTSLKTEAKKF